MLSTPEFAAFSKKVVTFLHVTTRIEGRAHEGLLMEKGFRGFPSLAFMDAEGEVIGKPAERNAAGFDSTLTALTNYQALAKRVADGEEGLDAELLLVEQALGKVEGDEFATRAKALENVTKVQQAQIDQVLIDNEVLQLAGSARGGGLEAAAKRFIEMLESKKMPGDSPRIRGAFWQTLANYATEQGDGELLRKAADGIRKDLASNPRAITYADSLGKTADQLERHAVLAKKIADGAEGLQAEFLVLEYDLGKTKGEEFVEQAKPLLASASADQKAALEERILGVELTAHLNDARSPAGLEGAATAILELLGAEGTPPKSAAGPVWSTLLRHAKAIEDPDLMDRCAAGLAAAFAGQPGIDSYVAKITSDAKAMREAKSGE